LLVGDARALSRTAGRQQGAGQCPDDGRAPHPSRWYG
jgi:hypothetical protein